MDPPLDTLAMVGRVSKLEQCRACSINNAHVKLLLLWQGTTALFALRGYINPLSRVVSSLSELSMVKTDWIINTCKMYRCLFARPPLQRSSLPLSHSCLEPLSNARRFTFEGSENTCDRGMALNLYIMSGED
jgi:hypothetical protein